MTTTLIIIRHAKPADSHLYPDEGSRPLVEEGRQKQQELANILKSKDLHPKIILSSPLLRAKQSAEILSEILDSPWQEEGALSPIFNSDKILSLIPKDETVMIVGHVPTLEIFTQHGILAERRCFIHVALINIFCILPEQVISSD